MSGIVSHNLMNLKAKQLEEYLKEEQKNNLKIQSIITNDTVKTNNKKQKITKSSPPPIDIDCPSVEI